MSGNRCMYRTNANSKSFGKACTGQPFIEAAVYKALGGGVPVSDAKR